MLSLTSLALIADPSLPANEVWVHPDILEAVRKAFVEADLVRSLYQPTRAVDVHPFSSVGDEDDAA